MSVHRAATAVLLASLALGGAADAQTAGGVILRSRTIVRITPPAVIREDPDIRWKESKAAKCQPLAGFAAAVATESDHMDLLVRDGTRLRARFNRGCRGEDFYAGFYVRPSPDGMLCAGRDSVRARSGMTCRIDKFRRLRAER